MLLIALIMFFLLNIVTLWFAPPTATPTAAVHPLSAYPGLSLCALLCQAVQEVPHQRY